MSDCTISDLQVPASAEIVIEGVVEPGATTAEGPFGNHTGGYDSDRRAPLVKVLAVHARPGAIYPWTLVGPPPMENIQLARVTERLFLPLLKMALPTLKSLHLPAEGIFHRAAILTVDPSEVRPLPVLSAALGETLLLKGSKLLVVGAADHDPADPAAVFWRLLNRVEWSRDLLVEAGRLTIDARHLPPGEPVRSDPVVLEKVLKRWKEYGMGG
jgi:4-hydroxy-3-polyprenylbenzoate decarboxylase